MPPFFILAFFAQSASAKIVELSWHCLALLIFARKQDFTFGTKTNYAYQANIFDLVLSPQTTMSNLMNGLVVCTAEQTTQYFLNLSSSCHCFQIVQKILPFNYENWSQGNKAPLRRDQNALTN